MQLQLEIPFGEGLIKNQECYYPNHSSDLFGKYLDVIKVDRYWVEEIVKNVMRCETSSSHINTSSISSPNRELYISGHTICDSMIIYDLNEGKRLETISKDDSSLLKIEKINTLINAINLLINKDFKEETPSNTELSSKIEDKTQLENLI
mgnify:CR=1 FL=1